ncbi:MAG: AAA family ATPase [Spirochaetia bacterium]|nr:AAA family ATPase [Spirochaetia bacterium]
MIEKIKLIQFGKFSNAAFPLTGFNVFLGPNESGKTTVQDAFFYSLCRPSAAKSSGKELKKRYGEMEVELDPDISGSLGEEEYRQLFSIKAENIIMEISDNSKWLQNVKNQLFTGGISPDLLVDSLTKKSSLSMTHSHMRNFSKLTERENALKKRMETLLQEKQEIHNSGQKIGQYENQKTDIDLQKLKLKEELKKNQEELFLMEKIREKIRIKGILKSLNDLEETQKTIRELSVFSKENFKDLEKLDQGVQDLNRQKSLLKLKKDEASENLGEILQKSEALSAELSHFRKKDRLASVFLDRISIFRRDEFQKKTAPAYRYLVYGFLLILSAPSGWFFSLEPVYVRFVIAAFSSFAALYFMISFLRDRISQKNINAAVDFLQKLKDEWRSEFSEESSEERLDSYESGLYRIRAEYSSKEKSLEDLSFALKKAEEELKELDRQILLSGNEINLAQKNLEDFLKKFSIKGRDEFLIKINEAERAAFDIEKLKSLPELKGNIEEISSDCRRKLINFDEEGIPSEGYDDLKLNRLKTKNQNLESDFRALEEEEKQLSIKQEGLSGEVRGSLKGILDELHDAETELNRLQKEKNEIEMDRLAAGNALDIFKDIKNQTENSFSALEDELQKYASHIFLNERNVSIKKLHQNHIQIEDSGGTLRSIGNLSTGTRDSFVFASRLALASKISREKGILLLDDPFLHLDEVRIHAAVKLLKEFSEEKGWQIIFFTKEEKLSHLLAKTFHDVTVHLLN